jgi:hypothetical protein
MQHLTIAAAMMIAATSISSGSEELAQRKELVASCRAAVLKGGYPGIANGVARISYSQAGEPYVFIGDRSTSCKFGSTSPPQLTEVFIGSCYECGVIYGPELIDQINELLRQQWAP